MASPAGTTASPGKSGPLRCTLLPSQSPEPLHFRLRLQIRHLHRLTCLQRCKVFVKHERVALARTRPAQADNCFAGRVTGSIYLGDSTSYAVALAGGFALKAVVPNRSGFEHFAVGDEVVAAWAAVATLVFPA